MEEHNESAYKESDPVYDASHQRYGYGGNYGKRRALPYMIPFSIILAGVIIAGAIMMNNKNDSSAPQKQAASANDAAVISAQDINLLALDARVLGNPEAAVTIVEFADFQCPFCGRFYKTTEKEIIDTYVKTGKAKFIYRDFAFLGDESSWAAQAARCAGDQGIEKFWQYHDYIFEHQNGENEGAFAKNNLKKFARELGLNTTDFNACLDSGKHEQAVQNDTVMGQKVGVNGTPATFVNGKLVQGAVPFSVFQPMIEDALNGK